MCNIYEHDLSWADYSAHMAAVDMGVVGERVEMPARQMRPSEPAPVIRGDGRLEMLKWGWSSPGRPGLVINIRSEGRRDPPAARGLTIPKAFYEYAGDKKPKSQFRFTPLTNEPLAFAVLCKGDAYSLLTCEPGAEVAPIHNRQPVLITRSDWRRWLTEANWPADLMRPSPPGTLRVEQTR
ncbi:MAG TPA: SOS response-associated peptidase family protein [Caulobacteraceae bacterium]|nr:SOS response-associated peptidase family protein [Caulobacteraceae bacterium]